MEINLEFYKNKMMKLVQEVKKDMKKAEVPFDDTVPFFINSRLSKCLGKCYYQQVNWVLKPIKIEISLNVLKNDSDQEIKNVICHELIHSAPNCICCGHKNMWKIYANRMNYKNKNYRIETRRKQNIDNLSELKKGYNIAVVCEKCGATTYYMKKGKVIKAIENNTADYICKKCYNDNFKVIYNK